ncbi:MAG: hypothetical protein JWP08_4033 [Bryobacterales bacterium]|nr:hypothetical protein [Bryobacterales bacterium]
MGVRVEPSDLEEARIVAPGAEVVDDGGHTYVYMPQLKLPNGESIEALLQLTGPDPYFTRLYLPKVIEGKGPNWTVHQLLNKTWHTWSWKDIQYNGRIVDVLRNHLEPLR